MLDASFETTTRRSLLAPLLPVLAQPLGNDHSSQKLLDSRAPLRSFLRNRMISLRLKSLHKLLVIPRHFLRLLPTPQLRNAVEDSCKSLGRTPSTFQEQPTRPQTK